ncbi:MAG: hypothetical protein AAFZ04_00485 [Pseudomonadota bacterium]
MESKDLDWVRDLVMRERQMAVSDREWKHRVRGYGYGIKDTENGRVITSLLRDRELMTLGAGG